MRFKLRRTELTPPYVPMADIAFNLVLFFLIMVKTKDDRHIVWTPAKAPVTKQVTNAKATVAVDQDNRTYLNGEQIGVRDLADAIGKQIGNEPPEKRTVLLKVHKDTLAATFEPIMEAVSQAGGEVVHVVEEER